jgi:hypothetical protein
MIIRRVSKLSNLLAKYTTPMLHAFRLHFKATQCGKLQYMYAGMQKH